MAKITAALRAPGRSCTPQELQGRRGGHHERVHKPVPHLA